ncbi:GTPase-activating protein GYP1-like [Planoprotostelium fungivorum]|uniref:GTPase-activating protein GYP1-like n=1 Tax=Planoprotostelium fungivorum TaxID=1890364 RepID=A0A2P6NJH4_9EUKA|nr:GTPase-activating protein GYP1-like [Planoprotostelium fungivorum]
MLAPTHEEEEAISTTSTPSSPPDLRAQKLKRVLQEPIVDMAQLRKLSWQGIPPELRANTWRLLLDYLPANADRRNQVLDRKREEYSATIPRYFDVDDTHRTNEEQTIYKQIQLDVPRTLPTMTLFQNQDVQQALARVLYIWGIRHPASGYVQGINDLATPFIILFLQENMNKEIRQIDPSTIPSEVLTRVEADTYWCLTKLLDGIQDNYTFAQPGIQRMMFKLSELVKRIDAPLYDHLKQQEVDFAHFSFTWMNCLLLRAFPMHLSTRIWDTYLAEVEPFSILHVYVCAAFLCHFSAELRSKDFQDMLMFLNNPPTQSWNLQQIDVLLSQAYLWKSLYENSPKHLNHR